MSSRRFVKGIAGCQQSFRPIADLEADRAAEHVADDVAGVKAQASRLTWF